MNYFVIPGITLSRRVVQSLTPEHVTQVVGDYYGINPLTAIGKNRRHEHVLVRQLSMWILRKKTPLSLKSIGGYFKIDHTSVIHAVTAISGHLDYDEKLQRDVKEIMRLL